MSKRYRYKSSYSLVDMNIFVYLGICCAFTAAAAWSMVTENIVVLVVISVLFILLQFLKFETPSIKMCLSWLFFVMAGFCIYGWVMAGYEKYGMAYVLGSVKEKKTEYHPRHNKSAAYMSYSAVVTYPVYGLSGNDSLQYTFRRSSEDLDAPFPIEGDYAVLKYAIGNPGAPKWELDNPTADEIEKYRIAMVITPDSTELVGSDAIEYIEDCKNRE